MWQVKAGRFEDGNNSLTYSEAYDMAVCCGVECVMATLNIDRDSYNDFMRLAFRKLNIPRKTKQKFWAENGT